ncbi:MAG: dihydropteroate synthase, partial [Stellaceae bacterium]
MDRTRLCPEEILSGAAAQAAIAGGRALPLAGGALAFAAVEAIVRVPAGGSVSTHLTLPELRERAAAEDRAQTIAAELARLSVPRPLWAGFTLDRPLIMGILNITPDSFSDGGDFFDAAGAAAHGEALL